MSIRKRLSKADKIDALKKGIKVIKRYPTSGLCWMVNLLYGITISSLFGKVISYNQKRYLLSIIPKVSENNKFRPFYWKMYAKAPRIRFLQEQIKKLEKK
jgi:hypothetical protein